MLASAAPGTAQQAPSAAAGGNVATDTYADQLRDAGARLDQAIGEAQGASTRTQTGAMPQGQQKLMDATQKAWSAMRSGAPESMRGGATGPYADADHTFRRAVETMRVGSTPPDVAVAQARDVSAALGRLREAAAEPGGGTAGADTAAPSPAASGQPAQQEPPAR